MKTERRGRIQLPGRRLLSGLVAAAVAVAAGGYLAVGLASAFSKPEPATAQSTNVLSWLQIASGDGWYNFDFRSFNVASNNVDWPMRFIFYDNAEINKVKDRLDGCGNDPNISPQTCSSGGAQYHQFNDNGYNQWDADGGIKNSNNCTSGARHMRVYANPANVFPFDRNYSTGGWGFYIFGSVHLDFEGGQMGQGQCISYYSDEIQEGWWVQRIANNLSYLNWQVWYSYANWYNYDAGHWDVVNGVGHFTRSDGYASYVAVP